MTKTTIALGMLFILFIAAAAFLSINRPLRISIDAPLPVEFPQQGFSHASLEELLQIYVTDDGRVDYSRWHEQSTSRSQLNSYLAAVSHYSPDSAPKRFPSRNDELAYWLYSYNAYVIRSVLDHWPLESVTDVKAPLEAIKGLGFFHQQRFSFGGEFLSLLEVENKKIRKEYQDPRIHFVLNCASESCPIARPGVPVGEKLDEFLYQATIEFINDPENVAIDHDNRVIHLSTIFKWYEDDFVNDVRLQGKLVSNGLVAYISRYALDDLSVDVAKASDYKIQFRDYDWGLNSSD